jgi:two-component system chemotaxis response regulator CheB
MSNYKAIVIGGSAGSFQLVLKILSVLPKDFKFPVFFALHRSKEIRKGFAEALSIKSNLNVVEPHDKQIIRPGNAYLAPSNYHMLIELGFTIALSTEEMVKFSRPAINLTFETASYVYRDKLLGILLSGANSDGAEGMKKIKERGGYTIVQNPDQAMIKTMPEAAIKATQIDQLMSIDEICSYLLELNDKN